MKTRLKRMWVNQPSTLQMDHKYHGMNVLVNEVELKDEDDFLDAYFVKGDMHSARLSKLALDDGWKE